VIAGDMHCHLESNKPGYVGYMKKEEKIYIIYWLATSDGMLQDSNIVG